MRVAIVVLSSDSAEGSCLLGNTWDPITEKEIPDEE
jgi:hypothetical protein